MSTSCVTSKRHVEGKRTIRVYNHYKQFIIIHNTWLKHCNILFKTYECLFKTMRLFFKILVSAVMFVYND